VSVKVIAVRRQILWRGRRSNKRLGTVHEIVLALECGHEIVWNVPIGRRMGGEPDTDGRLMNNRKADRLAHIDGVTSCMACGPVSKPPDPAAG